MAEPKSPLTLIREWEDYLSVANGELAARCRTALGVSDPLATVYVHETAISGGYSEYTHETDYVIRVYVEGGPKAEFEQGWYGALGALLRWLDDKAPVSDG